MEEAIQFAFRAAKLVIAFFLQMADRVTEALPRRNFICHVTD